VALSRKEERKTLTVFPGAPHGITFDEGERELGSD
jgi:hypothetical protein